MPNNSSDYFAYKRNKFQSSIPREEKKPTSKLSFLFKIFLVTFIIIFIAIVFMIMKYSQKIDIEYSKGDLIRENYTTDNIQGYNIQDEEQKKIDKRLLLIQQEENAPSEAKILEDNKKMPEIIDSKHLEETKAIEKENKKKQFLKEQQEIQNEKPQEKEKPTLKGIIEDLKQNKEKEQTPTSNITIMSKVLIGRYATFDEAQIMQNKVKTAIPNSSPYVRKIGDVYGVQFGSYQDFSIAKTQANNLKSKGFDVWIYQQ